MAMAKEAIDKNSVFHIYGLSNRVEEEGKSIEVEAEFSVQWALGDMERVGKTWKVVPDGSLLHNGLEFISKKPKSNTKLLEDLEALFKEESFKTTYINSPRTSTHVHVNVQNRTKQELFTILTVYYLVEDILFHYVEKARGDNLFCLPMYGAESSSDCVKLLWENRPDLVKSKFNNYKYAALNVANVAKLGTIEFRHHEGTKNLSKISGWLDLIDSVCESYKVFPNMKAAYDEYVHSYEGFIRKVFPKRSEKILAIPRSERNDINLTKVFEIVDFPNQPTKEIVHYQFKTAAQADDLKFDYGTLYRTTPMPA